MPNPLLDVDESIIKNNLLLPETKKEDEDFEKLMKTFDTKVPSVTFRPHPGICIKTKTDDNQKIFINICHTTELPPPSDISDEKLIEILDEETPNWCVPMSIGHERFEEDKTGTKCLTYDIAINKKYFDKIQSKDMFFTFTVVTMFSAIGEKYNRIIDGRNYVVLKNRKVMGTLHDHRVQKRDIKPPVIPKPLIEEVPMKKQTINPDKSKEITNNSEYIILRQPKSGKIEKLIGYFKLPSNCLMKDVKADIGEDRIVIDVTKFNYFVDVFVPFLIDQQTVTASMDQNLNILRLDMPVQLA